MISKLLVVDPKERYTMEQSLSHPWLVDAVKKARADLKAKESMAPTPMLNTTVARDEKQANCTSCSIL